MRNFILLLHIITSIIAGVLTGIILIRAIGGMLNRISLSKRDVQLPFAATLLLYFQLILGTVLFIIYMVEYSSGEVDLYENRMVRGRFWAVEHFILMMFTLVVSHIGWIFAKSNHTPQLIFKKNLLYFGFACTMIMVSMVMNIIRYVI